MSETPPPLTWRRPEVPWGLAGISAGMAAPAVMALVVAPDILPTMIIGAVPASAIFGLVLIGWMLRHTDATGGFRKTRTWVIAHALLIGVGVCAALAALMSLSFGPDPVLNMAAIALGVVLPSALAGGLGLAFISLRAAS